MPLAVTGCSEPSLDRGGQGAARQARNDARARTACALQSRVGRSAVSRGRGRNGAPRRRRLRRARLSDASHSGVEHEFREPGSRGARDRVPRGEPLFHQSGLTLEYSARSSGQGIRIHSPGGPRPSSARSHKWHYDSGEWREKKITPDLWQIGYAVTKRRAGHAPEGSGVPVGTEYHWYVLAHQNTTKRTANDYTTSMTGLKFKIAHKRAGSDKWSATPRTQRKRMIAFLQSVIADLEKQNVLLADTVPAQEKSAASERRKGRTPRATMKRAVRRRHRVSRASAQHHVRTGVRARRAHQVRSERPS